MASTDMRDRLADHLAMLARLLRGDKPEDRERVAAELERLATS